jgi:hypothetical protein
MFYKAQIYYKIYVEIIIYKQKCRRIFKRYVELILWKEVDEVNKSIKLY